MKKNEISDCTLESVIECALALLDPKGTNTQISQAMSIVRIAFAHESRGARVSSQCLYEKACQIYPSIGALPNPR